MTDSNPYSANSGDYTPPPRGRVPIAFWIAAGIALLLLPLVAMIAFVIGGILGQEELYHARASEQAEQMRAYLYEYPDRFGDVTIERASDGWSYLTGTVKTQQDLDDLRAEMGRLFGAKLGKRMTSNVKVVPKQAPKGGP
jgi:hypothetical protein